MLAAFGAAISRAVDRFGSPAELGPIRAYRADARSPPESGTLAPVLCAVAQGRKEVVLGQERHVYGAGEYLLNSTPLPAMGRTLVASRAQPCLWLSIRLESALVLAVAEESRLAPLPTPAAPLRSLQASAMELPLARSLVKLAWLFEAAPDDFLTGLAMRELIYRLLVGPQAVRARQILADRSGSSQVALAARWLRDHFDQPLSVERLARQHRMSPSVFYLRFKQMTAMSPLQFQKQLRLQEARRLIQSDAFSAAEAGTRVGYDSPSHFSRDYRRFFGEPPRRHAATPPWR